MDLNPLASMIALRLLHETESNAFAKSSLSTRVGGLSTVAALDQFSSIYKVFRD
jgi:hypothetical protein